MLQPQKAFTSNGAWAIDYGPSKLTNSNGCFTFKLESDPQMDPHYPEVGPGGLARGSRIGSMYALVKGKFSAKIKTSPSRVPGTIFAMYLISHPADPGKVRDQQSWDELDVELMGMHSNRIWTNFYNKLEKFCPPEDSANAEDVDVDKVLGIKCLQDEFHDFCIEFDMKAGWGKIFVDGVKIRTKALEFKQGRAMRAVVSYWGRKGLDGWCGTYDPNMLPVETYIKDIQFTGIGQDILNIDRRSSQLDFLGNNELSVV